MKRGLLLPLSPPVLPMLPVPDDGDSRLPCRANEVLGLGTAEEDFTPSVLGAEADLPPALAPNNLKEKQITTSVVPRDSYPHSIGFQSTEPRVLWRSELPSTSSLYGPEGEMTCLGINQLLKSSYRILRGNQHWTATKGGQSGQKSNMIMLDFYVCSDQRTLKLL